jgi:hypothetical protein
VNKGKIHLIEYYDKKTDTQDFRFFKKSLCLKKIPADENSLQFQTIFPGRGFCLEKNKSQG